MRFSYFSRNRKPQASATFAFISITISEYDGQLRQAESFAVLENLFKFKIFKNSAVFSKGQGFDRHP